MKADMTCDGGWLEIVSATSYVQRNPILLNMRRSGIVTVTGVGGGGRDE
jgi:hypothetical protein